MSKSFQYHIKNRHATWLELFFDLVFVASIGIVTHQLAETSDGHLDFSQVLYFPIQFLTIWWIWTTHTLFSNRFNTDSLLHRIASLAIMFLMVAMTAFLGDDLFENYKLFIAFYLSIRFILAGLYFSSLKLLDKSRNFSKNAGSVICIGAVITGFSIFFESPFREIVIVLGILFEMGAFIFISKQTEIRSIHREHLVERIGLLSIILLGESIISLVGALRDIAWDTMSIIAAVSGFIMIGLIWWIYYDSFNVMEKIKAMKNGFSLIYSHLFLAMGFVILANVIRHSIINDISREDFRVLAIIGMCFFYIGKQTVYFKFLPPFRRNMTLNTIVCVLITVGSTFLPKIEYALIGITLGMFFYTISSLKYTLSKNMSKYLESDVL